MTISYPTDKGVRYAWMVAPGKDKNAAPVRSVQYAPPVPGSRTRGFGIAGAADKNIGNYGVLYDIAVNADSQPTYPAGEQAQILLNTRGGEYLGTVETPALKGASSRAVDTFDARCQKGGKQNPGACAVGVGQVEAAQRYSFSLMPPSGAVLPVRVVLSPAYIEAVATLTYTGGCASSCTLQTVDSDPAIIQLKGG